MRLNLNEVEIRVLGSLMEKELATPENYPLSMNALQAACNQKSNRDPVMSLTEAEILQALSGLGAKGLARRTTVGGRVDRYCHNVADKLGLSEAARAVLSELMLRGPQTPGELRNRAERMAPMPEPEGVDGVLADLLQYGPPLVMRLPRQPGRKEQRFLQLFAGTPDLSEFEAAAEEAEPGRPQTVSKRERILRLHEEIGELRSEVAELHRTVMHVIASFN